jgi:hypothetical protein
MQKLQTDHYACFARTERTIEMSISDFRGAVNDYFAVGGEELGKLL